MGKKQIAANKVGTDSSRKTLLRALLFCLSLGCNLGLNLGCSFIGSSGKETPLKPSGPGKSGGPGGGPHDEAQMSCQNFLADPKNDVIESLPFSSEFAKRQWLDRVSRKLRYNKGMTSAEWELVKNMKGSEVIDLWMEDPLFSDTTLDFNMYHWGWKKDSLRDEMGQFVSQIFDVPNAILAAQALASKETKKSGNNLRYFESLFLAKPPTFLPPPSLPFDVDDFGKPPQSPQRTPLEIRLGLREKIHKDLVDLATSFSLQPPTSDSEFCDRVSKVVFQDQRHLTLLFGFGYFELLNLAAFSPEEEWYIISECTNPSRTSLSLNPKELLDRLDARNERYFVGVLDLVEKSQVPTNQVSEIKSVELANFGVKRVERMPFGSGLKSTLPNSSTNMNRKRASYVLERFFCDSLLPINVEDPGKHVNDRHASDVSCRACHYKLDPMAGFFVNYGRSFSSFEKAKFIIFDDGARSERSEYLKNWQDPESAEWNIGYVRSPTQKSENFYGKSMDDLFGIIAQAPEAKRCLTQRMFEYVVTPGQIIDSGYLNFISKEFSCLAEVDSTQAYKRTIKRLLLSESFRKRNLVADQCYDFAPGGRRPGAPPCQVDFILQKNCVVCHSSVKNNGRLDLSRWNESAGKEANFPHLDENGKQILKTQTMAKMSDLLNTSDLTLRMPKDRFMAPADREVLFRWINDQMK